MTEYLKAFIIGSSWVTLLPFFLAVMKIPEDVKNYSYQDYTLVAPFWLGIMNMFGLWLSRQFGYSGKIRYLVIGIISGIIVSIFATASKSYNWSQERWNRYYPYIILKHVFTYFVVMQTLSLLI